MARFGLLSTFCSTRCGLLTFTAALAHHTRRGARCDRHPCRRPIQVTDRHPDVRVTGVLRPGDVVDRALAAEQLNECDVVIVQHEYGIYGGRDGDEVLDLLRLRRPTIADDGARLPRPHQRSLLQQVSEQAMP